MKNDKTSKLSLKIHMKETLIKLQFLYVVGCNMKLLMHNN